MYNKAPHFHCVGQAADFAPPVSVGQQKMRDLMAAVMRADKVADEMESVFSPILTISPPVVCKDDQEACVSQGYFADMESQISHLNRIIDRLNSIAARSQL